MAVREHVRVADEVWIATALLHREQPARADFTVQEIVDRVRREAIVDEPRSIEIAVSSLCVANKPPGPSRLRLLYETGRGRRRLYRPGDQFHPGRAGLPGREGTRTSPARSDLPERFRHLVDWYEGEFLVDRSTAHQVDPILGLRALGKAAWAGTDPDHYVRSLRAGW